MCLLLSSKREINRFLLRYSTELLGYTGHVGWLGQRPPWLSFSQENAPWFSIMKHAITLMQHWLNVCKGGKKKSSSKLIVVWKKTHVIFQMQWVSESGVKTAGVQEATSLHTKQLCVNRKIKCPVIRNWCFQHFVL